jgi:hypothetical protein
MNQGINLQQQKTSLEPLKPHFCSSFKLPYQDYKNTYFGFEEQAQNVLAFSSHQQPL